MKRDRFHALLPDDVLCEKSVFIVGVGGIGGYLSVLLAKMGIEKITVVDFDAVEETNVATQVHGNKYLYWPKVAAVRDQVFDVNPECVLTVFEEKFDDNMLLGGEETVVVTAVDSLPVRHEVVKAWCWTGNTKKGPRLLVDPRMALEACEVNLFTNKQLGSEEFARYYAALKDEHTEPLPCGAKAVAYKGSFAATMCAAQIRRFLVGRRLPYFIAADVGCGRMESEWFSGEKYEPELLAVEVA